MSRRSLPTEQYESSLSYLGGKRRLPLMKEELWRNGSGVVVRYSLAFIDPLLFAEDNGRVLGYDNAHGHHHRHYFGVVTPVDYATYESLARKFLQEVQQLRRRR